MKRISPLGFAVSLALASGLSAQPPGRAEVRMASFASFKNRIELIARALCDDSIGSLKRMEIRSPRCSKGRDAMRQSWATASMWPLSIMMTNEEPPVNVSEVIKGSEKAVLQDRKGRDTPIKRQEWSSSGI
jgi:hypothetical protein